MTYNLPYILEAYGQVAKEYKKDDNNPFSEEFFVVYKAAKKTFNNYENADAYMEVWLNLSDLFDFHQDLYTKFTLSKRASKSKIENFIKCGKIIIKHPNKINYMNRIFQKHFSEILFIEKTNLQHYAYCHCLQEFIKILKNLTKKYKYDYFFKQFKKSQNEYSIWGKIKSLFLTFLYIILGSIPIIIPTLIYFI